ncbi:MAG: methyltransferase domain-containing protein [Anaerolineae bacterium]|nr:methyltransferase domain-containing protein [Anaerolineae bacterium]
MKSSLLDYFDRAAGHYRDVEPAFGPLADALIEVARLKAGEWVLDVGAGSGLVARSGIALACFVFALDFSRAMLQIARGNGVDNLLQSDMRHLSLRSSTFDVVLASFALNSTDPMRSLAEIWRVLVPEGRFVLQEWGAPDPLSEIVSDTIAEYAVDDPLPELAAMRAMVATPVPWDDIDGPDDIVAMAAETGFCDVEVGIVCLPVILPDVGAFIRYKLAWPDRRVEINAMDVETRRLCLGDLQENLAAYAEDNGSLIWRPKIFRIRAFKPVL